MNLELIANNYNSKLKATFKQTREIYDVLLKQIQTHNIILIGLRQVGKTALSEQLLNAYLDKKESTKLIIAENSKNASTIEQSFYISLKAFQKVDSEQLIDYISRRNFKIVFIDEIQEINEWPNFAQSVIDLNPNTRFIFTGSNAYDLNKEIIFGRAKIFYINPLSYIEYKKFWKNENIDLYFKYGSYPKFANYDTPESQYVDIIHEQIIDKIINNDAKAQINNVKFKDLMKILGNNVGTICSFKPLRSNSISAPTISLYYKVMEQSRLLKRIWKFHDKSRKPKGKIYYMDKSLIYLFNEYQTLDGAHMGHFIENVVFNYLDNYWNSRLDLDKICYYNSEDNKEIDFIIESEKLLIEVKYNENLDKDKFILKYNERISEEVSMYKRICINKNISEVYKGWVFISITDLLEKGVDECIMMK